MTMRESHNAGSGGVDHNNEASVTVRSNAAVAPTKPLDVAKKITVTSTISKEAASTGKRKGNDTDHISQECPADYILAAFRENGFGVCVKPSREARFFLKPTDDMVSAYTKEALQAIRDHDIEKLRKMHQSGHNLQCCNRFGESLIHLACRRGSVGVVKFLVEEAKVSLHIHDDYGRTPFHDACWSSKPNFDLLELLIRTSPEHLLLTDVRGHTPFHYVRKSHWKPWIEFLSKRKDLLRLKCDTKLTDPV